MAKNLLIVESPTKARTLGKYLGKDFVIKASVGHVKDLPKSRMGVDVERDFAVELEVIPGKKKVVSALRSAAKKAERVLLAPDPDREGEAIAWHIAEELKTASSNIERVTFNEITRRAVLEALKHPRALDRHLYEAQQARRVLDRLVGYEWSPLLWTKVQRGLSAGRVQSVAVRLVVEREKEIEAFVPQEYWSIEESLHPADRPDGVFSAKLGRIGERKAENISAEEARRIREQLLSLPHRVESTERQERQRRPYPPFTTSKLQQAAAGALRFSARRTMQVAQRLYEGVDVGEEGPVGLITYMRTDSTRVAHEAQEAAREYIRATFGAEHVPEKPPVYRSRASAQDAHEAIRPTDVRRTPEKLKGVLSSEQWKLYDLIWRQFVSSQMSPARYDRTVVLVRAGEYELRAAGSVCVFPGWLALSRAAAEDEEEEGVQLPPLAPGEALAVQAVEAEQHFTQPPPRFNEGTLVKELEERGIGRPSTYATIMDTIQSKGYVEKEEGRLRPTTLGRLVTELLLESFPQVMSVDFTAAMEQKLDEVEEGRADWVQLVREFYQPFALDLEKARTHMRDLKREEISTEHKCERCGAPMVIKWGRHGHFLACSAYPECKNTKEIQNMNGNQVELAPQETTSETCDKCGKPMIVKRGRFGRFLACSGYPECKNARPMSTGVTCPQCGQHPLVERRSKRGKVFFSCRGYPKCKYSTFDPPLAESCPKCGFGILVKKSRRREGAVIACPREGCDYRRSAEPETI